MLNTFINNNVLTIEQYDLSGQMKKAQAKGNAPPPKGYFIPKYINNLSDVKVHIKDFPRFELPEIFGLEQVAITQSTLDLAQDLMHTVYKFQFTNSTVIT